MEAMDPLSFSPVKQEYENLLDNPAAVTDYNEGSLYSGPSVEVEVKADPEDYLFDEIEDIEKDSAITDEELDKKVIVEVGIHKEENQFTCPECGRGFSQSQKLQVHMMGHTGEQPYTCDECQRSFSSSSSLKAHLRNHPREKSFNCTVCEKNFFSATWSQKAHENSQKEEPIPL
ncbi:oocyte zinc finger protein XlCOF15-like [Macrobrachium nipponense]|uniref:oocyte zinc finger protein XlCOF15-like n=1 Tax=Macrobrachium nipponense TaxID=159736 RepID=UPI0030C7F84A